MKSAWVAIWLVAGVGMQAAVDPQFSARGPQANSYGQAQGFPVGNIHTMEQPQFLIGSYSHFDAIFPSRGVPHGVASWKFKRAGQEPAITYEYDGKTNGISDYLTHLAVTGLLIAKDDKILVERYQYGRTDRDRPASASLAKTLVAMVLGAESAEHPEFSVDKKAQEFVPALANSLYGGTAIRDLLHMRSGVEASDGKVIHGAFEPPAGGDAAMLAGFRERWAEPGTQFHYSCGDSETLGLVAQHLAGKTLTEYLSEKIWQPIGAEEDASWAVDRSGQELACFGFNATLRDWARVGRLLAFEGNWNGRQIIPRPWVVDATTMGAGDEQVHGPRRLGYGYQVWILPGERRMFALLGSGGQFVLVDPRSKLVMVQTAVGGDPMGPEGAETLRLWAAVVAGLGGK